MRLTAIEKKRIALSAQFQAVSKWDISDQIVDPFMLQTRELLKRRIMRVLSLPILKFQQKLNLKKVGLELPFPSDLLTIGERFANDASLQALVGLTKGEKIERVLIPGCYLGLEDVQFWLRRGIKRLDGIDVYCLEKKWSEIVPLLSSHFQTQVNFRQASIEQLPFENESFDLIATSAVLEHVRNIRAMVYETARVLRPGGWAWHNFGPLYYTYGGDHCMSSYGFCHGYDHLLLCEKDYQIALNNQAHFDKQNDPNLPFWARQDQFSFLTAAEYLSHFSDRFKQEHLIVKISESGMQYRKLCGQKWTRLLEAGVGEDKLLIKSLAVILRKAQA